MTLRPLPVLTAFVLAALALVPPASAQADSTVVGIWHLVEVVDADGRETITTSSGDRTTLSLLPDGAMRFRLDRADAGGALEMGGTYRLEAGAIVLVSEHGDEIRMPFHVEGDVMTIVDANLSETSTLKRIKDGEGPDSTHPSGER